MTRDKAIEILAEKVPSLRGVYGSLLDAFIALGMLKLDEPGLVKRVYLVAADALEERGVSCNSVALEAILSDANLKIVEK